MQILNIIIATSLAVLLFVFLKRREKSTKIITDIKGGERYQYELKFYAFLDETREIEKFICCSDAYYKNPLIILKESNLIQKGFLVLPKEQEIVLIKMDDIKKITMHIRKNEIMSMKGYMCVPKSGTQSKRNLYAQEDKK